TTALLAASVEMLNTLGLWYAVSEKGAPLKVMRIADGTTPLVRAPLVEFSSIEIGLEAFGANIPNEALNAALRSACQAADTLTIVPAMVADIELTDARVLLTLDNGERYAARLATAADGRNSPCRAAAGIEVRAWKYDQSALVLNFSHTVPHRNTSTEFHTETGPFTMVPLPGNRSSLVCVVKPEEAARLHALTNAELSAEVERRGHSVLGKVSVEPDRQIYPMSVMLPKHFAAKRVALVGEAAHVFPPIGAQGLNLGLRDVAALAEVVANANARGADIGGPEVMAEYDRARKIDVESRTRAVDLLNRTLLSDFLPIQGLRGFGLYLAGRLALLRRAMMREGVAPRFRLPKLMRGIPLG
ncbi:MAG: UbiH/UbiF family hydroxylase, partial [Hyphomicrobiales bacterium]|nr:UbiH/UbiF family hydroxylase [Hyphomicrobiales bacterium]